jgi:hypothetical protein
VKRFLALVLGLALVLIAPIAFAAWLSSGSGAAVATATSVNQGHAPVATRGSGTVTLTWTASTLASGSAVGGYTVRRHDGSTTSTVCSVTTPTLTCNDASPVATTVTYDVVPTVGAHWTGPESPTTSFTYDNVAPTTTAAVSPLPNGDGWNKTSVTVTLSATDPAISSGVDHLTYTVDAGSPVTAAGSATSFSVSGAGTHTVTYVAVDGAGNTESTKTTTVKIDPSAPVTSVTPSPAANGVGWNNSNVTLNFSATDVDTSGVKSVTVDGVTTNGSTASKTITAEGTSNIDYFATDVADNVEGTKTATVKIDKTNPTSAITPTSSSTWIQQATQSVTITGSDATSGVASISYTIDGGSPNVVNAVSANFSLGQGDHTITYHAVDLAGNVQADQSATIRLDNVVPTSSIAATTSTTWTITAADAAPSSGVSIEYWVDSGSHTTIGGTTAVVTVATGSHAIHWFAKDAAGNQQAQQDLNVTVSTADTIAPTVTMSYPSAGNPIINNGQWTNSGCTPLGKPVGLCGTASDNVGVVGSALYELRRTDVNPDTCWNGASFTAAACGSYQTADGTGASWQIPLTFANVPNGGTFELRVKVSDAAGNTNRPGATPGGTSDVIFTK